jgi:hypothetical protein
LKDKPADGLSKSLAAGSLFDYRSALLQGPLRFDYCPGSLVSMEVPEFGTDQYIYGVVLAVTMSVNNATHSAETWAAVGFTRTAAEQEKFAVEKHPFYKGKFLRAPLLNLSPVTQPADLA